MLYSSGTTGRPKGIRVPLTDAAPGDSPTGVEFLAKMLWGATDESIYLSPAPLYHSAPLRFTMAMQRIGGTVVVMEQFDPDRDAARSSSATRSRTSRWCRRCSSAC